MTSFANRAPLKGPYDLPPELHYLRPPAWKPTLAAQHVGRTASPELVALARRPGASSSNAPPPRVAAPAVSIAPSPSPRLTPPGESAGPPVLVSLGGPKLLVRVRAAIQMRQYSPRTEDAYVQWIRRFIFFHKLRHPAEMGERRRSGSSCRTWPCGERSVRPRRTRRSAL